MPETEVLTQALGSKFLPFRRDKDGENEEGFLFSDTNLFRMKAKEQCPIIMISFGSKGYSE